MTTGPAFDGPVVFDCEALTRIVSKEPYMTGVVTWARTCQQPVVISAATIVEAAGPRSRHPAMLWAMSRLTVRPVTKEVAVLAATLLSDASRKGHAMAIDAMVCATALLERGRPTIYTSDPTDIQLLTTGRADVIPLR